MDYSKDYIFYCTIRQGSSLKHILELLQGYFDKKIAIFTITDTHINTEQMTDGSFVFVKVSLKRDKMSTYYLGKSNFKFGVSSRNWYDKLKSAKAKEPISWYITKTEPNKLYMEFLVSGNCKKRHFVPIQTDLQEEEYDKDESEYGHPICIDSINISGMCKECNNKSSKISIKSNPNYIIFTYITGGGLSGGGEVECIGAGTKDNLLHQELRIDSITKLQKISQISKRIQLYPPSDINPLKLKVDNDIGEIIIYINTEDQMAMLKGNAEMTVCGMSVEDIN